MFKRLFMYDTNDTYLKNVKTPLSKSFLFAKFYKHLGNLNDEVKISMAASL